MERTGGLSEHCISSCALVCALAYDVVRCRRHTSTMQVKIWGDRLKRRVQKNPRLAICVESSDWDTGQVFQVIANGDAEIIDYDIDRGRRLLSRYLGPDESTWSTEPDNYPGYLQTPGPPGIVFLKIVPRKLVGYNFTYGRAR